MSNKKQKKGFALSFKLIFTTAFSVGLIIIILTGFYLNVFELFENKILDFRFIFFNQNKNVSKDVVFIDVDEDSLQEMSKLFGGWPWPRGGVISKRIVDFVMMGHPAAFLFDVLYTEYSPKSPDVTVPDEDMELVDASMYYPNLSHAALFLESGNNSVTSANDYNFLINVDDKKSNIKFKNYPSTLLPFDPLYYSANSIHSVNHQEDDDGVSRQNQMLIYQNGKYYPSLALKALQFKFNIVKYKLVGHNLIMIDNKGKKIKVPLNKDGNLQLNFYHSIQGFTSYPASSIIASNDRLSHGRTDLLVSPEDFKDKIIIFGASATGLKDIKVTPMGKNFPGPYIHMTAISNILKKHFLYRIPRTATVLLIIFSILMIVNTTIFFKKKFVKNIIGLGYIFVHIVLTIILFKYFGVIMELATTLTASVLSYFGALIFLTFTEEAEKKKISNAMSKYLAPAVMKEVLTHYKELEGEVGQKKEIAILFSDIRSFTTISENFPPETVVHVLNTYLKGMINIIFDNRGTVDKFIGDAIMAFWGAPNYEEERDYLAVSTGFRMIQALKGFNEEISKEGDYPTIRIGVGVNTGDMIVGNIGSEKRLDYTVIGDNVNLGSRIEGLTKYYKLPLLVTGPTYQNTKDRFVYTFIDTVAVKGKDTGVKIYTPLADKSNIENASALKQEVGLFNAAHKLYLNMDFEKAKKYFTEAERSLTLLKDISGIYKQRCEQFIKDFPGENWDKIWRMHEK